MDRTDRTLDTCGHCPHVCREYQTGAASMLLTMRYGKSLLARAKILTAILYATTVYWGIVLTYAGIYLMIFGPQGEPFPYRPMTLRILSVIP